MEVCILDVPILVILGMLVGYVYSKKLLKKYPDSYFHISAILVALFWINALLSYLEVIRPWIGGWVSTEVNIWIALIYVLSYPLWYLWGTERACQIWGRTPEQAGVLWPFRLKDKSEPFKPAWKS